MIRIKNSNWTSCLFWFGTGQVGIQKKRSSFLKEAKATAFRSRSPTAAEATFQNERESEQTTILSFSICFG